MEYNSSSGWGFIQASNTQAEQSRAGELGFAGGPQQQLEQPQGWSILPPPKSLDFPPGSPPRIVGSYGDSGLPSYGGIDQRINIQGRGDSNLHARSASIGEEISTGGFEIEASDSRMRDADVEHHLKQGLLLDPSALPKAGPSRTLIVRNVSPEADDEELGSIFKSFGDVKMLYSESKSHGLVIVSYYDLRSATAAKATLLGTLVNGLPLEIYFGKPRPGTMDPYAQSQLQGKIVVYNLDPDTTNDHMSSMFAKFGEVQEVSQNPERPSQKFITFFDVRHAATALQAMNRAEHLGKLPSHITPQQAASMAFLAGSSPSLGQLAALQLQHNGQQNHATGNNVLSPQHGGSPLSEMELHTSDSASSIAGQLLSGHRPPGLGKGLVASMAAAAAAMGSRAPQTGISGQTAPGSCPAPRASLTGGHMNFSAGQDQGMQAMLMNSGFSASDAAAMLMSLGLSSDTGSQSISGMMGQGQMMGQGGHMMGQGQGHLRMGQGQGGQMMGQGQGGQMMGQGLGGPSEALGGGMGGGGMFAHTMHQQQQHHKQQSFQQHQVGSGGADGAAMMAALQEMQSMQARQQQIAAVQAQLASQIAGMQAQHVLATAAGLGAGGSTGHHQLTAAQLIQAAGLNAVSPSNYMQQQGLNLTAMQLLQQAGLSMPQGFAGFGGMNHIGGNSCAGPGDMMGQGGRGGGSSGDSRGGGGGRLSRRTTDPAAEAERKAQQDKLYGLDFDKIYSNQDRRTTLMIKNIPNKYTQKMLLATIDEFFHGSYDFFYLPIDFKNKCNVGYAFINMTQPVNIVPLVKRFHNKKWERFNSEKICHISYARIQGRSALISHFQNSSLMHEDKRCRPILFVLEGSEATGEQEPFPPTPGSLAHAPHLGSTGAISGHGAKTQSLSNSSSYQALTASSSMASLGESCGGGSSKGVYKAL